jgi:hypothetical protein
MLHDGREFTVNVAIADVTEPHVPVTIARYEFASTDDTGEIVYDEEVAPAMLI